MASAAYYDLALFFAASPVSDYSSDDNSVFTQMPSPTSPDAFNSNPLYASYDRDSTVAPGYRNNAYRQEGFSNNSGYELRHPSPSATSPTYGSFYPPNTASSSESHPYDSYVASSSSQQQPLPPSSYTNHYSGYEPSSFSATHNDTYPEPSTPYVPPSSPHHQDGTSALLPPVDNLLPNRYPPIPPRIHPSLRTRSQSSASRNVNARGDPGPSRTRHSHHPYPQTRRDTGVHRGQSSQVVPPNQQQASPTLASFTSIPPPPPAVPGIIAQPPPTTSPKYSYGRSASGAAPLEKNFICKICNAAFARNHDLNRHHKVHDPVKQYRCNGCDRSFTRKDALKRHATQKNCGFLPNAVPAAGSGTKRTSTRKTASASVVANVASSSTKSTAGSSASVVQQLGATPQSIPQAQPSYSLEAESSLSQSRRNNPQLPRDYLPYYSSGEQ
ncbi:hypothetical protein FRC02_003218 [Tulasnella sp. 418]|nr:hypothetical protein FRC02_003218 [Tulasnella sp. 418]